MADSLVPFIAASAGLCISVAVHASVVRAGGRSLLAYSTSLAAGAVSAGLIAVQLATMSAWPMLNALVLFGAWWFVFLNFVQTSESSLRVRILREIVAAGGSLPWNVLRQRYDDELLIRLRLGRLLEEGAVVERDGRLFVVSARLRCLARFFNLLKRAVLGRCSEFETADAVPLKLKNGQDMHR